MDHTSLRSRSENSSEIPDTFGFWTNEWILSSRSVQCGEDDGEVARIRTQSRSVKREQRETSQERTTEAWAVYRELLPKTSRTNIQTNIFNVKSFSAPTPTALHVTHAIFSVETAKFRKQKKRLNVNLLCHFFQHFFFIHIVIGSSRLFFDLSVCLSAWFAW